jgi:predicted nucleic acid-binding protein
VIVVDSSALFELLLRRPAAVAVEARLFRAGEELHVPHLIEAPGRCFDALEDLAELHLTRYPHGPLLPRIWELRDNLTAYDAAFVALAETLNVPLITRDRRIANAPGHDARIELI